jgi:hypothetical protein
MFNLIGKAFATATTTVTPTAIPQLPATTRLGAYFGNILAIALWIGGGLAVVYLVWAGIMYVTAGGDQEKATQARTAIVNAIIGIVIIALALTIVTWIGSAATSTTGAAALQ